MAVTGATVTLMAEQVVALDLDVTWEPNAPEALLLSDDYGKTVLALMPHPDDPDRRCVVLVWSGVHSACLAAPNDEAISGHRLYASGLSKVLWAGTVLNSEVSHSLEVQNRVHPRHDPSRYTNLVHHVILMKECVAEVVAEEVQVIRLEGTTRDAVVAAIVN